MNTILVVFAVIVGLMLAEMRVSLQHERHLRARGAIEPAGDVYAALSILYPAAFAAMTIEGLWRTAASGPDAPAAAHAPSWFASGVLLFVASKALKYWAIRALGERWTFRVYVLPGVPLVATGPYRYVAHPNYIAVVGELVGTAMMMGAWVSGPVMTGVFALALRSRIRFEERALR